MGLGFGLLTAQLRPGETSWKRAYDDTIEIGRAAERLGYSSVWTSEHHFIDDGYMPSLLVVSAALAASTSDIEIGTGVLLAPLHHPLRLAEDAATVQLLSGNRLILGLGLGWADFEFAAFGVDSRRRGRIMDELLGFLPRAWSGEVFEHRGDEWTFPELAVRPTPDEPIPVVIGGTAEPAIRRAARLADGIYSNAPLDAFIRQVEWVREELAAAGRSEEDFRFLYYTILHPADTAEAGWAELRPYAWHMDWKYGDMRRSSVRSGPPPPPPELTPEREATIRGRAILTGPADDIVEELQRVSDAAGVEVEFVTRSYHPMMAQAQQIDLMARIAEEILPHV